MASSGGSHHVVPVGAYIAVFLALIAFTGITVWAAGQDFGPYNTAVAVGIAVAKATMVVLIFMHVRWGTAPSGPRPPKGPKGVPEIKDIWFVGILALQYMSRRASAAYSFPPCGIM